MRDTIPSPANARASTYGSANINYLNNYLNNCVNNCVDCRGGRRNGGQRGQ